MKNFVRCLLSLTLLIAGSQISAQTASARVGAGSYLQSSSVLIPIDSLVPQGVERKVKFTRICGSCGDHGAENMMLFLNIKRRHVLLSPAISSLIPAPQIAQLLIPNKKEARKYGEEAHSRGLVIIVLRKAFEEQFLASLPVDVRKSCKL